MPKESVLAGERRIGAVRFALREFRRENGLIQESRSVDASVKCGYLGAIERGDVNVTLLVLARLCGALNTKSSELLARARL
jgi:transcriptional regulator with XRE-family HTH domain